MRGDETKERATNRGEKHALTWTMPRKELDHPYCAASGTTATDMTTRWALQSSITAATSATTLALSGNAEDARATVAAPGGGPTASRLALHMATTRRPPILPPSPGKPAPPLPLLLAQLATVRSSRPNADQEEEGGCIDSLPGAPKPAHPTLVDLCLTGPAPGFTDTQDLTDAMVRTR